MRNVRVWFKKQGAAQYISHLDLTRCMARAVHRAQLPVWYSKGFHPRASLVFALPLSLGVCGERECVDLRLEDDSITNEEILQKLNAGLPAGLPVFAVTEPVMKPGKIAYASYELYLEAEEKSPQELAQGLNRLLSLDSLVVTRRTKRAEQPFDLRPYLTEVEVIPDQNGVTVRLRLPAGSEQNVNPRLYLDAAGLYAGVSCYTELTRTQLYDENGVIFE